MKNDKKKVYEQLVFLSQNYFYSNNIELSKMPSINEYQIGYKTQRVDENSYINVYDSVNKENKFIIRMVDGGLICLKYLFDKEDNIVYHNIAYLPYYDSDLILFRKLTLTDRLSGYIRIDFDPIGKKEYTHTLVHCHFGINSNLLRIPMYHEILPLEFVYLVLMYVYEEKWELLSQQLFANDGNTKLSEKESERFFLSIRSFNKNYDVSH